MNEKSVNKKDVANTIATFITKHQKDPDNVEWPQWDFRTQSVSNVTINEEPLVDLEKTGKLWTFEGTADIYKTDGVTKVLVKDKSAITGSAEVTFYPNDWIRNELLPEVKHVTITKIEL